MKKLLAFLLCLMVAVPAFAGPPLPGTYKSTDLGGTVLTGRYSETWNGGPMMMNNTVNEASWDGATLGGEWTWSCAYVAGPPVLVWDGLNGNGDGQKIWQVSYIGGTAILDGSGPWGNGEPFYTATVDTWEATVTEQYVGFVEVGTIKTVNATASIVGPAEWDLCIVLALSNLEKHGDGPTHPGFGYPGFIDNTCSPAGGPGEWGEVDDITYSILGCTISTEETSWGQVKALYR